MVGSWEGSVQKKGHKWGRAPLNWSRSARANPHRVGVVDDLKQRHAAKTVTLVERDGADGFPSGSCSCRGL